MGRSVARQKRERDGVRVCFVCNKKGRGTKRTKWGTVCYIDPQKLEREGYLYLSPDKIIMYCVVFIHRWRPQEEIERERCVHIAPCEWWWFIKEQEVGEVFPASLALFSKLISRAILVTSKDHSSSILGFSSYYPLNGRRLATRKLVRTPKSVCVVWCMDEVVGKGNFVIQNEGVSYVVETHQRHL